MGRTPLQIVTEYPHLSMAQVHAALAYYWSHQEEIHQDIQDEDERVARLEAQAGRLKIRERLAEQDATDDSFSPG